MFDELERLRTEQELHRLLCYYAERGKPDREVWQDRLGELEGADSRLLVRLHGELLAHGWVEQNTGATPALRAGADPQCYRITSAGLKALRQVETDEEEG